MLSSHKDESFSRAITHIKQATEAGHLHEAQEQAGRMKVTRLGRARRWNSWKIVASLRAMSYVAAATLRLL